MFYPSWRHQIACISGQGAQPGEAPIHRARSSSPAGSSNCRCWSLYEFSSNDDWFILPGMLSQVAPLRPPSEVG